LQRRTGCGRWNDAIAAFSDLTAAVAAATEPRISIWTRISEAFSALAAGEGLSVVFDRRRASPVPEAYAALTIAVIALGTKMAKADSIATREEVTAFRRAFNIPPEEETNAARVFNLARGNVTGFDAYPRKIRNMFGAGDRRDVFIDLISGLFHAALADATLHAAEDGFLHHVADIFDLDTRCYPAIRAQLTEGAACDPYDVPGVAHDADFNTARAAWRAAVKDSHPDVMIARGVPPEAVKLAKRRLIAVNMAWEEITAARAA